VPTVVAEELIKLRRESPGLAMNQPAGLIPAFEVIVGVGFNVGDHHQVEVAVAVQVSEARGGRPARRRDAGLCRDIRKCTVSPITIQDSLVQSGDEQVLVSVVVKIGDRTAHTVTSAADPGPLGDILEGSVTAIAKQLVGPRG
jgi:hypothetical protein